MCASPTLQLAGQSVRTALCCACVRPSVTSHTAPGEFDGFSRDLVCDTKTCHVNSIFKLVPL
jgi:hypothetical protein